jgi:aminoglycoside 6-adenylyltransferase
VEWSIDAFLEEVVAWAQDDIGVRGVVLLGSQARTDTPADALSDVDLAVFVDDPARYLDDGSWVRRFGEPLLSFLESTAIGGFVERRVLFASGREVDFSILAVAIAKIPPPEARAVLARGFRVLYDDKAGLGEFTPLDVEAAPPTQAQLDQLSHDFWYHLLWAAKKLRRGELLLAKQVCDCYLTGRLVELARWRAHGRDTWHELRFFERWAGDDVVEAVAKTFARYEAGDVARALHATAELFGRLEDHAVKRFGLSAPVDRSEILRRLDALTAL